MYAMIRRYRMAAGSIDDLMHKVDTQYADRLQEQLSILNYQAIDTGDGTIVTVTVFEDEERYRRSAAAAARVRDGLAEFQVEDRRPRRRSNGEQSKRESAQGRSPLSGHGGALVRYVGHR
jgi:hypothetical protein